METVLPPQFTALEAYVAQWAVAGANQRALRRSESTTAERTAFYEAARAALPKALAYLDAKPLAAFDPSDQRLMHLMLSLAHVALAAENHGELDAEHALGRQHLPITRAPSDA